MIWQMIYRTAGTPKLLPTELVPIGEQGINKTVLSLYGTTAAK